jgi:two-component system nitrate/nitrite response regulator NarL
MLDTGGVKGFRIVIADDHHLSAKALADSFIARGADVLAIAHSVPEALEALTQEHPDVLISDLDMGPGPSGVDLAVRVRAATPDIGVVLLTAYEEPKLFSSKMPPIPPEVVYMVKQRVREIDELEAALALARDYARGRQSPARLSASGLLTDSQADLLRLLARGLSNQAIADELSVSQDSVAKSINRLAKRLGVAQTSQQNVRVALSQRYFDFIGYQRER